MTVTIDLQIIKASPIAALLAMAAAGEKIEKGNAANVKFALGTLDMVRHENFIRTILADASVRGTESTENFQWFRITRDSFSAGEEIELTCMTIQVPGRSNDVPSVKVLRDEVLSSYFFKGYDQKLTV